MISTTPLPPPVPARDPDDLARFFVERANAGDLEGLVALYEPDAVLAVMGEAPAVGHDAIRAVYTRMLQKIDRFPPAVAAPTLRQGDLALTSSRLRNGAVTAEVARRRPDGSWRWILDQPAIAKEPREAASSG
jgi:ketosteroid isomerase-like protein